MTILSALLALIVANLVITITSLGMTLLYSYSFSYHMHGPKRASHVNHMHDVNVCEMTSQDQ